MIMTAELISSAAPRQYLPEASASSGISGSLGTMPFSSLWLSPHGWRLTPRVSRKGQRQPEAWKGCGGRQSPPRLGSARPVPPGAHPRALRYPPLTPLLCSLLTQTGEGAEGRTVFFGDSHSFHHFLLPGRYHPSTVHTRRTRGSGRLGLAGGPTLQMQVLGFASRTA